MKTLKSLFILFVSLVLFAAVQGQCHGGMTFDLAGNDDGCFDCGETISPTVFCYESNSTLQTGMIRMTLTDTLGNGLEPASWVSGAWADTINGRVYVSTISQESSTLLSVTYQTKCNYQGDYIAHARFASIASNTGQAICWQDSSWRVSACGTLMGLAHPGPEWIPKRE